jgi:glyoxylase-like metal-dependent hydrolase (beta-lactamase superfamily II)
MNRIGLLAIVTSVALFGLAVAPAIASASITKESYLHARQVLDAAVEATGGAERINGMETVVLEQQGTLYARNQSVKTRKPYDENSQEGRSVLDLRNGWLVSEATGRSPSFVFSNRTVIKGEEKYNINLRTRTFQRNENLQAANFDFMHRLFPPLMLRKALERAGTVRWLGRAEIDTRPHDVLTFAWDNGQVFTLFVDAKSHLLTKYELLFPDALTGDAVAAIQFRGYRIVDGLQIPGGFTWHVAGDLFGELSYTLVEVNKPLDEKVYAVPDDFAEIDAPPTDLPKVTELAKDVFIVEGLSNNGYNVLFVAFDDYILVMEAPVSSGISSQAIARIKETVPDKPIRYLVLSHHHDDHSGGMRAFVAEGAKIVTTRANEAYFERMASASYSLAADALTRQPRKPEFEFLEDKKVFEDENHVVEILDIGPSPHAEELFIAYLPNEKILFEADLLGTPRRGPVAPASEATLHFARTIEKLGLEVETLVGVHGKVGSPADLEAALAGHEAQRGT